MKIPEHSNSKPIQLEFDFDKPSLAWPPNSLFPLNISDQKRTVLQEVDKDIKVSDEYLVVTGFTSLAHIIDSLGSGDMINDLDLVRIVLGWEPNVYRRKNWGRADLQKEIKDYWLERGYSVFKGGNVIKTIGLIEAGKIQFKISDHLHAKIYVGNSHAILGSANFSKNGLTKQQEANIRVANSLENSFEKLQYQSIFQIANNFYEQGKDYKDGIINLLKQLLEVTSWEEALARAIAELIDGNWFNELPELRKKLKNINLWPSQRAALAQAFYVLQNQGCVLIADPTGSGKTKLISALHLLLFHWLWETGRKNNSYALIVCPPIVQDIWDQEFLDIQFIHSAPISMGLLSNSKSAKYHNALKKIQAANIFIIDEAHNYLNFGSRRSENLAKHTSDYVILSTATPISKRARDLLRLIELLDIDNLTDEELSQFKQLKKSKLLQRAAELDNLREYIQKFMVRRTKKQLKKLIQREPEQYRDKFGALCQYPKTISSTYKTGETKSDRNMASEINELAWQLKGVLYLQRLDLPEYYSGDGAKYIETRLKAAKALSVFMVQAKLRSSRAAIVELVEGTKAAAECFSFKTNKPPTGDFLKKIKRYQRNLPKYKLSHELLPSWLTDIIDPKK
jgi:energy-coupling factor transporter ATP-binding protein EcfA2